MLLAVGHGQGAAGTAGANIGDNGEDEGAGGSGVKSAVSPMHCIYSLSRWEMRRGKGSCPVLDHLRKESTLSYMQYPLIRNKMAVSYAEELR